MVKINTNFSDRQGNPYALILSDIHADHLQDYDSFVDIMRQIRIKTEPSIVMICGDIGTQRNLEFFLRIIASAFSEIPVFFVLGNHDAYFGTIRGANYLASQVAKEFDNLFFLHNITDVVKLTSNSAIVGINGWYDARHGDENTDLMLSDFEYIDDLRFAYRDGGKGKINEIIRRIADEDAENLRIKLTEAAKDNKRVYVLTHVPPFKEVVTHMEQDGTVSVSGDKLIPYFSNKALGDVLLDVAQKFPQVKFEVICGHTHSFDSTNLLENLCVWVMQADYKNIAPAMEIVIP